MKSPARRRQILLRAQAYALAAMRDFQHFDGRAADDEASVQVLLNAIAQGLTDQPP